MVATRRQRRSRRSWHSGHTLMLFSGWNFFHNAWQDDIRLSDAERAKWPPAEVLEDMERCYRAALAGQVEVDPHYPLDSPKCWAFRMFELNESPLEARRNCR